MLPRSRGPRLPVALVALSGGAASARVANTTHTIKSTSLGPGAPTITGPAATGCATAGILAPKLTYRTDEGSCSGITIVRDKLYVACARGARLYRATISGTDLTNVQQYFVGTYGRLRTVEPSIDGGLWITTTTTGDKDSIANNSNEKVLKVLLGQ